MQAELCRNSSYHLQTPFAHTPPSMTILFISLIASCDNSNGKFEPGLASMRSREDSMIVVSKAKPKSGIVSMLVMYCAKCMPLRFGGTGSNEFEFLTTCATYLQEPWPAFLIQQDIIPQQLKAAEAIISGGKGSAIVQLQQWLY